MVRISVSVRVAANKVRKYTVGNIVVRIMVRYVLKVGDRVSVRVTVPKNPATTRNHKPPN